MEGSKSEAVFDSMNLNPQLFINATINTVDDVADEAFDFFTCEASKFLKIDGGSNNRSQELSNGIDRVRGMIQSVLDNRLKMWEGYCVRFTFAVPEEFVMPESDESSVYNDLNIQDGSNDQELDAELDSLRHKLNMVGKRSAELNSELQALKRTSVSNEQSARLVNEALELYDKSSVDDMFKEMANMASELRAWIGRLKTRRMKAVESGEVERLKNNGKEFPATTSDGKLEDLEMFLAELRKM
uniref:Protein MIS12-like protein n=1 Tax=Noccaea caerulescens TaxID=107243 RepID=A0A1J3FEH2_NOCCA